MGKKVLIIGGVAAGMKTASRLRRRDKDAEITVIERGELVSYGACGFPYYIGDEVKNFNEFTHTPQGVARDVDYFKKVKGIDVLSGHEAQKINRAAKTVTLLNRKTAKLQKCLTMCWCWERVLRRCACRCRVLIWKAFITSGSRGKF